MKYLIVIQKTRTGFCSYVPDLDGCVAAGKTRAEVVRLMRGALKMHLEGMREEGTRPPRPTTTSAILEVPPLAPLKELRGEYDFSRRVRGVTATRCAEGRRTQVASRKQP